MASPAATIIGALIGAAAGDAVAQEKKKEKDKINKIEALKTLYSPWRNETGRYQPGSGQIGQIASGAMTGAAMGQGMPSMGKATESAGEAPPAGNMVMQSSENPPGYVSPNPTGEYLAGNMYTSQYLGQPGMTNAMATYNPYRQSSPGAVGNFYPYGNKP